MSTIYDSRRYLTDFDSRRTGNILADVLVIGSGVAGMRAAIAAAQFSNNVLLACKRRFGESATFYAQGGIASVTAPEDSLESHIADTLRVGCGLGRAATVERVVRDGQPRVKELLRWGMRIDMDGDSAALGREGGHSFSRIVHCDGAATGREVSRALGEIVRQEQAIRIYEHCFLIDLITHEGRCVGAATFHRVYGHQLIWAKQTILATGGCGRTYRETTNPSVCTGDGYAAAYRAGATLADMEMVQFHPTTLYVAGSSRTLVSEAVRGAGAHLIDRDGHRFMKDYHPDEELAPRDIVSRAIVQHTRKTRSNCVYLDVRHLGKAWFEKRFSSLAALCEEFQIDVSRDPIPVRPAAHYMVGGVVTDLDARTNLDGLLCCGEVACTGLHGANRLASNSLLEGLVFGAIAGETAGKRLDSRPHDLNRFHVTSLNETSERTELDLPDIRNSLRSLLWRNAGIERNGDRLAEAKEIIEFWGQYVLDKTFDDCQGWEIQNMLSIARLIVMSAGLRPGSLGVHFRTDAEVDPNQPPYHIEAVRSPDGIRHRHLGLDFEPLD